MYAKFCQKNIKKVNDGDNENVLSKKFKDIKFGVFLRLSI